MTIDTGELKVSTKALVSGITTVCALLQIDVVKQFVLQLTARHPHITSLVVTAAIVGALLHNPQVEQVLGMKRTVKVTDEEVTLKEPQ